MDLLDAVDWLAINSQNNGVYTIVLGSDQKASNIAFNYNNKRVSISLKASGGERKIAFDTNNPTYALFTVGAGVTFTLENGITITGLQNNGSRFVTVEGGTFIMNGGTLRDNKSSKDGGGGVYIASGTFVMNNGTISGNSVSNYGGGVYIESGTFTMNGGTISGNSTRNYYGGGVYVKSGTFTMNGGVISGNYTSSNGGGVCVGRNAAFTKSGTGGVIYGSNAPEGQANKAGGDSYGHAVYVFGGDKKRNNTARASNGLDSTKSGAAGGWE
jgi:hypothetical protein